MDLKTKKETSKCKSRKMKDLMKLIFASNLWKRQNYSDTLITIQMKFRFLSQLAIDILLSKNVDDNFQSATWFKAMKKEYDSLDEKPLGNRWHFALNFGPL